MFLKRNTSILQVSSALSYGVFLAKNRCHSIWNLLISKIVVIPAEAGTPAARFILPGAVFYRYGLPAIEPQVMLNKPGRQFQLFCSVNFMIKLNLLQKTRAEHGADRTEGVQTLLSKKEKLMNLSLSQPRFYQERTLASVVDIPPVP